MGGDAGDFLFRWRELGKRARKREGKKSGEEFLRNSRRRSVKFSDAREPIEFSDAPEKQGGNVKRGWFEIDGLMVTAGLNFYLHLVCGICVRYCQMLWMGRAWCQVLFGSSGVLRDQDSILELLAFDDMNDHVRSVETPPTPR